MTKLKKYILAWQNRLYFAKMGETFCGYTVYAATMISKLFEEAPCGSMKAHLRMWT